MPTGKSTQRSISISGAKHAALKARCAELGLKPGRIVDRLVNSFLDKQEISDAGR